MSGYDLSFQGFDTKGAAAAIGKSFLEEFQRGREKKLMKEVEDRKALAEEFEKLAEDQALDEADRRAAMDHARALRMLPFEKKRPKEYQPDPKAKDPQGNPITLPSAMLPLLYKKALKQGPGTPAQPPSIGQPPAPSDPSMTVGGGVGAGAGAGAGASVLPPMPQQPGLTMGAAPEMSGPTSAPPQPGGDHFAANAISPAPAIGGMPGAGMPPAPGAPASGAPGVLPPPPAPAFDEFTWQPKFRSAEEIAAENARLKGIENTITLDGKPVDARALPAMGRQQTAGIQMRKLGLNPDGSPIPLEQLTPKEQADMGYRQSQMELADARIELSQAQAAGIPAQIQIALGRLQVAQRNADTAERRAAIDSALYGSMLGGMNGPPGLLGSPDMGINDPIEAMTEQVLTNQIPYTSIPSKLRPLVSLKIAERGGVVMPQKTQDAMLEFAGARAAIDTIYDSLESYVVADGVVNKAWAAHQLRGRVEANSRIVGKALGELRITDQDKADFVRLLSPGIVLSLTDPQRAQDWVRSVELILDRVEKNNLQSAYQRVYARKDGTLDTFKPGSKKNVVGEIGGSTTPATVVAPMSPSVERWERGPDGKLRKVQK